MIIAAIKVSHWRRNQLFPIDIIQAVHPDGIKLPARRGIFSPSDRTDAAMPAKHMVNLVRLIMQQRLFTGNQPESLRRHNSAPSPRFGAHLAVALEGARVDVNISLEADGPAMTTSPVGPFHGFLCEVLRSEMEQRTSRLIFG